MRGSMSRRGFLLFAAMCVIWGIPYLLIRVSVRELSPATLVLARTAIATALLLPIAAFRRELRPVLPKWAPLLAFAAIEIALPWVLLGAAEQHVSSSLTGPADRGSAARRRGDRADDGGARAVRASERRRPAARPRGCRGDRRCERRWSEDRPARGDRPRRGLLRGRSLHPPALARRPSGPRRDRGVARSDDPRPTFRSPPSAFPRRCRRRRWWDRSSRSRSSARRSRSSLFFALIAEIGAVRATVITYVNPAVAAALGVGLLGERFTPGMGVGFALVLLGSALATRRGRDAPASSAPALDSA